MNYQWRTRRHFGGCRPKQMALFTSGAKKKPWHQLRAGSRKTRVSGLVLFSSYWNLMLLIAPRTQKVTKEVLKKNVSRPASLQGALTQRLNDSDLTMPLSAWKSQRLFLGWDFKGLIIKLPSVQYSEKQLFVFFILRKWVWNI